MEKFIKEYYKQNETDAENLIGTLAFFLDCGISESTKLGDLISELRSVSEENEDQ